MQHLKIKKQAEQDAWTIPPKKYEKINFSLSLEAKLVFFDILYLVPLCSFSLHAYRLRLLLKIDQQQRHDDKFFASKIKYKFFNTIWWFILFLFKRPKRKSQEFRPLFLIQCFTLEAFFSVNLSPKVPLVQRYLSTANEIIAKISPTDSKANSNATVWKSMALKG